MNKLPRQLPFSLPLRVGNFGTFDAIIDADGRMICSIEWILPEDAEAIVWCCNEKYQKNTDKTQPG